MIQPYGSEIEQVMKKYYATLSEKDQRRYAAYEVLCPCCGERQRGKLPEGLEAGRYFGPRLEATVTMLHHEHHVGFERLVGLCNEIFNLTLSEGGAVSIIKRAGKAAICRQGENVGESLAIFDAGDLSLGRKRVRPDPLQGGEKREIPSHRRFDIRPFN